jgi:hypothetical protein
MDILVYIMGLYYAWVIITFRKKLGVVFFIEYSYFFH